MNPDLIYLFVGELLLILGLYRFLFRAWVIDKWEEKIAEEGYLVVKLEPVIEEIEDRIHEKLQAFQDSFFGSVGQMVKKGKELDPMNNIRKAAKNGDWTSMLVEYAANKSGLGGLLGSQVPENDEKGGVTSEKQPLKPQKLKDLLYK
jgi:hypothetical protein